ncbi:hypothetical protein [Pseudomonas sp. 1928-m]|uniref:hypothetical protein n=1 Tax=Pseudomonas sp. 1928-m TaxID=3033804 RepID=UPI0023DF409A|nr:hypothetical protein [Pseudomonas sp. 1928-m]MDF3195252.1 hypothetical protein [Pseudomonas sp. 1928-m]
MITPCLICDSKAILTRGAAMGTALLAGLVNAAIQGAQRGHTEAHDGTGHNLLLDGLAEIAPAYPQAMAAAEDVAKYHFAGFDCLCLRCGARYNDGALDATEAPRKQQ